MNFKGYELTQEQVDVVNNVKTGENTKVQAPAGSGKTFTLQAASHAISNKRGSYIAFNKAIADEARTKFTNMVDCRTGHSLAFGTVGKNYVQRLGKITGTLVANTMNIGDTSAFPTPATKGYLMLDTVRHFCYSADPEVSPWHVPKLQGPYKEEDVPLIKKDLAEAAQRLWDEMSNIKGRLPITHDVYLKVWALGKPRIPKDYILFDEAQDANPVMLDVITRQAGQQIYVGDRFQQIYAWRGAINAMEKLQTTHSSYITQSFRFGQAVADMANSILGSYMHPDERPPEIIGYQEQDSRIAYADEGILPDAHIFRTNAGVITQVFAYLEKQVPIYVQGGTGQLMSLLKGAKDLKEGRRAFCPDLNLFTCWEEVLEYANSEAGGDLKSFVKMVEDHGIERLIDAMNQTCNNSRDAKVTLTTAHKSKGLEWSRVKLGNDFLYPEKDKALPQSEINILYVAATRALHVLDVSNCVACHPQSFKDADAAFYRI